MLAKREAALKLRRAFANAALKRREREWKALHRTVVGRLSLLWVYNTAYCSMSNCSGLSLPVVDSLREIFLVEEVAGVKNRPNDTTGLASLSPTGSEGV